MTLARRTGVLLDIDGTLLLSNDAHARAFSEVLTEAGFDAPFERVRPLIGMGGDKVLPELTGIEIDSEEGKRLGDAKKRRFREHYLPQLEPAPGARLLLEHLLQEGLTLVVATSASGEELGALLKQAGVEDLVHEATSSSDAENSKPDPDIIHAALGKSGLRATQVVMLGDTPYDVEAAARAGVPTIAVRCGGWWDDAALGGAVAIYDDPADLLQQFDQSPLAGDFERA